MTLRFHVSPSSVRSIPSQPAGADVPTEPLMKVARTVEEAKPRGASHETWRRARGWSSED